MPFLRWLVVYGFVTLVFILILADNTLVANEPCEILVVDQSNNWPVPLVELTTNHHVRFVSDNAGLIAFDLPELMNVETWFTVKGHGYAVKPDGFGMRGIRLTPTPGGKLIVKVQRQLPAKRLGRTTGIGIFAEAQKLGQHLDWKDQSILGCDSVQNAIFKNRLFWSWGDTTIAKYPLGIFDMTGATTSRKPIKSFQPPIKLRYDYFVDGDKRPRAIAPIDGPGPTWLGGYASVDDSFGTKKLVAAYAKITPPLKTYEHGLCVWDEQDQNFVKHKVLWSEKTGEEKPTDSPTGHSTAWTDESGEKWLLFGDPFPKLKIKATLAAWEDPSQWNQLKPQSKVPTGDGTQLIEPHRGSIAYSRNREKWVCVFCQLGGDSSYLGEIWYCEADKPTGPWKDAVKIVTHDHYTFYNPRIHSTMVDQGASFLVFEATYTRTFSKTQTPTPRHDYNQILYRLNFEDLPNR